MKKAIVLWLLLFIPLFLSAQEVEYKVFKIKGEVCKTLKKGKSVQKEMLNEKDIIKDKEIISLTQGSELRLVDIRDSVMFVLHDQCAGSVKSLINTQSASRLSMTKKYFDFVVKSLTGNGFNEGIAAARTTAVYRDDARSHHFIDCVVLNTVYHGIIIRPYHSPQPKRVTCAHVRRHCESLVCCHAVRYDSDIYRVSCLRVIGHYEERVLNFRIVPDIPDGHNVLCHVWCRSELIRIRQPPDDPTILIPHKHRSGVSDFIVPLRFVPDEQCPVWRYDTVEHHRHFGLRLVVGLILDRRIGVCIGSLISPVVFKITLF